MKNEKQDELYEVSLLDLVRSVYKKYSLYIYKY